MQKNTLILAIILVLIFIILIYHYHTYTIQKWYWQTKMMGSSSIIAIVFSKPFFGGRKHIITSPKGFVDDLGEEIILPFTPKSIISSPVYTITVQLSEDYEYHPPSRCLNFIDDEICMGNISSLRISRSI